MMVCVVLHEVTLSTGHAPFKAGGKCPGSPAIRSLRGYVLSLRPRVDDRCTTDTYRSAKERHACQDPVLGSRGERAPFIHIRSSFWPIRNPHSSWSLCSPLITTSHTVTGTQLTVPHNLTARRCKQHLSLKFLLFPSHPREASCS